MPEKEMQQIKVYCTEAGLIAMSQPFPGEDDAIIIISPEQVDTLVKWLKEAKTEIEQNKG